MSEKLKSTVENAVDTRELADLSREKAAEIERSLEKAVEKEKSNAENENSIKHEAIEIAARQEKQQEQKESKEIKEDKPLTKKDIEASYKKTLENVQDQLSAPSRAFSKVIHNPVVEKTSDAIGNTVARPRRNSFCRRVFYRQTIRISIIRIRNYYLVCSRLVYRRCY